MSIRGQELQAERDFSEGKPDVQRLRPLRERDIEGYLVKRVALMGGEVRKVQWIGRRGAPDRLVMLPRIEYRLAGDTKPALVHPQKTLWIELKAPGVKPEEYQLREHARMQALGQRVFVVDSFAGVDGVLS